MRDKYAFIAAEYAYTQADESYVFGSHVSGHGK